ncbi:MAG: hypothetical protein KIT00_03065 [Rhodospirillales bacterium]|nr:hypothetical protein [Rhodospirillales bacterium]
MIDGQVQERIIAGEPNPSSRIVAADVEAVRAEGLASWRTAYWCPVLKDDFVTLVENVTRAFARLLRDTDPVARDILLADMSFVLVHVVQHMHAREVESSCRRKGARLSRSHLSDAYYRPDWHDIETAYDRMEVGKFRWRDRFRAIAKSAVFNRHLLSPRGRGPGSWRSNAWAIGSNSWLRYWYAQMHGLHCRFFDGPDLFDAPSFFDDVESGLSRNLLHSFFEELSRILHDRCGEALDCDLLTSSWMTRLSRVRAFYDQIALRSDLPETILLTNQGNPMNRIAVLAAKRQGVHVVGFSHGNEPGNVDVRATGWVQHAPCSEFVCISKLSAEIHADNYGKSDLADLYNVVFSSAETCHYTDLATRAAREPLPASVRRVMLIGYPLLALRYPVRGGMYFPYQLGLQTQIIESLVANGFEPLYKAHPEMKGVGDAFFRELGAEIVSEPFEKSWMKADALIFTYPTTTTFGVAVCTNRPIVLFDIEGIQWNPQPRELLKNRCAFVPARYDDRDRLTYPEEHLLAALATSPRSPDLTYVQRLMA